jgi:hypothetical protein
MTSLLVNLVAVGQPEQVASGDAIRRNLVRFTSSYRTMIAYLSFSEFW